MNNSMHCIAQTFDFLSETSHMLPPIRGYETKPLVSIDEAVQPLASFIPELDQMVWTVKENSQKVTGPFTQDEIAAIMLYSMEWTPQNHSLYYILNATLRSENRKELLPWFSYMRLLIHALSKIPSDLSTMIYRAVRMNLIKEFPKGKKFVWWSFTSCTSAMEILERFLGDHGERTIFNIECSSGKNISQFSMYKNENEILLYPARYFQVVSLCRCSNEFSIIHLKEIVPPFPLIYFPKDSMISSPKIVEGKQLNEFINRCAFRSEINLNGRKLNDEDMDSIVHNVIIMKQCKKLHLNENNLTSSGAITIANALYNNTTLEMLFLSLNRIGDVGVQSFATMLTSENSHLQYLFLSSTDMTDLGATYLAKMLETNTTLQHLALESNRIGDSGIQALMDTLTHRNTSLRGLYLSDNKQVTNMCVDGVIAMLKINRSLIRLKLTGCKISNSGMKKLRDMKQERNQLYLTL